MLRRSVWGFAWFVGLVFATITAMVGAAGAVPVEPGVRYYGSVHLEVQELGVGFTLPEGWSGLLPVGGEMFKMTPDDRTYVYATANKTSLDETRAFLSNPLALDRGVTLQPTAPATVIGRSVMATFDVTGMLEAYAGSAKARLGPDGVGIGFIAIGPKLEEASLFVRLEHFISGVTFGDKTPVVGGGTAADPSDGWDSYMRGRYVVRYFTQTGYTDEEHLWLCSDGSFRRLSQAASGAGAYRKEYSGSWQAAGVGPYGALLVTYEDGTTASYQLEYRDKLLYVNGKQYLRDRNTYCP